MSRLFFALRPSKPVADAVSMRQSALALAGKQVPRHRLHLTLRFLGNVPDCDVDPLIAAVNDIPGNSFSLELQKLGYFEKPKIAWLGPVTAPSALTRLVESLDKVILAAGIDSEHRQFKPHITLARESECPTSAALDQPIHWPVNEFYLCESKIVNGSPVYNNLAAWLLAKS